MYTQIISHTNKGRCIHTLTYQCVIFDIAYFELWTGAYSDEWYYQLKLSSSWNTDRWGLSMFDVTEAPATFPLGSEIFCECQEVSWVEKFILVRGIVLTVLTDFFFLLEANFSSRFSQGTHQLGWNWNTSPSPPGIFHQLIDYICPAVLIRCFRRCEESGLTHRWPSGVFQELVLVAGGMDIPFPRLLQRCLCMLPAVFCRCFCWCYNKKSVLVVYFARHVWITSAHSWICFLGLFVDEDFSKRLFSLH